MPCNVIEFQFWMTHNIHIIVYRMLWQWVTEHRKTVFLFLYFKDKHTVVDLRQLCCQDESFFSFSFNISFNKWQVCYWCVKMMWEDDVLQTLNENLIIEYVSWFTMCMIPTEDKCKKERDWFTWKVKLGTLRLVVCKSKSKNMWDMNVSDIKACVNDKQRLSVLFNESNFSKTAVTVTHGTRNVSHVHDFQLEELCMSIKKSDISCE